MALVCPAAANSLGCSDARALIAGSLPRVITVTIDPVLNDEAAVALDFWAHRLNLTFRRTKSLSACMIYIHAAIPETTPFTIQSRIDAFATGVVYSPGTSEYNGVAYIFRWRASVIAHELGHLFGCEHSSRGLMEVHAPADWTITVDELHIAQANRVRAVLRLAELSNSP